MRGLFSIACIVLAGCDDAIVLEVHPAPDVPTDTVQLFLGLGSCDDCPGIQPPGAPAVLPGVVLYREDSFRSTVVRTARVEDGVARFRIEPSDADSTFSLAVAVDANLSSAAVIRSLPLDNPGRYRVDLVPANTSAARLGPKPASTSGSFVEIWQQPGGTVPCMGFERWVDGRLDGDRTFIVPADDLDCDARRNDECAPYGFDATGVPAFEDATCTRETPVLPDAEMCQLGGPACNEVSGQDDPCAPTEYCLPALYCVRDAECADPTQLVRCLFGTPLAGIAPARLQCSISFQRASDNTHDDPCESSFTFDLLGPLPNQDTLACAGPAQDLLLSTPDPMQPLAFADVASVVTANGSAMSVLDLKLRWTFDHCRYKVELSGDKAVEATAPASKPAFVQLWASQSGGPLRKLLLPLDLTFVNGCSQASTCQLVTDSSIGACLR